MTHDGRNHGEVRTRRGHWVRSLLTQTSVSPNTPATGGAILW
jgi:hypothetical protein